MSLMMRCEDKQFRDDATFEPLALSISRGMVRGSPVTLTQLLDH